MRHSFTQKVRKNVHMKRVHNIRWAVPLLTEGGFFAGLEEVVENPREQSGDKSKFFVVRL